MRTDNRHNSHHQGGPCTCTSVVPIRPDARFGEQDRVDLHGRNLQIYTDEYVISRQIVSHASLHIGVEYAPTRSSDIVVRFTQLSCVTEVSEKGLCPKHCESVARFVCHKGLIKQLIIIKSDKDLFGDRTVFIDPLSPLVSIIIETT